jgi:hypothetical protein
MQPVHSSCKRKGAPESAPDRPCAEFFEKFGPEFSKTPAPDRQISLPIATAVSDIRFENPHSLSYQVRIRQSVPSITLVWSI